MVYPNRFETASPINANYDYFDLFSLTGYKRFYPCAYTNSSATTYALTTEEMNADPTYLEHSASNTGSAQRYDTDYDMEMKTAQQIGGDFLFNFTFAGYVHTSGSVYASCYVVINIYHVNTGGTETLLGTGTSATITSSGIGSGTSWARRQCMKINISDTSFGPSEKLRVNVLFYTSHTGVGSTWARYYIDPSSYNLTSGTYSSLYDGIKTNFTIDTPFKISN